MTLSALESTNRRKSTFWYLLLVASFIAAAVSLLTTGLGLHRYLSALLAWPLAIAVQLGLFGLAWLISLGRGGLRGLVIALYCLTMPFSVVFSYVMLQSELTAHIRPQESQRALYDEIRKQSAAIADELGRGVAESQELSLRLNAWLDLERATGWTVSTCAEDDHCFLDGVCERLQKKVAQWEEAYRRPYRQGPGEQLIFGQLQAEADAVAQIGSSLRQAKKEWDAGGEVFAAGIDNRERLRRFDRALSRLPAAELEAMRCQALALPPPPSYGDFARDEAAAEERPLYAFEDLTRLFARSYSLQRSDYPTLFALGLAIFIDLFVLLVAIGAAILDNHAGEGNLVGAPSATTPPPWGASLKREIDAWIDGSRLEPEATGDARRAFLTRLMDALRFETGGRPVLLPEDAEQRRFGFLMTQSQAARAARSQRRGEAGQIAFILEGWVYPALTQYLTAEPSPG